MPKFWVDPPSGWKYGFPKELEFDSTMTDAEFHELLISNGYPKKEIEKYKPENFPIRFWKGEEDGSTTS